MVNMHAQHSDTAILTTNLLIRNGTLSLHGIPVQQAVYLVSNMCTKRCADGACRSYKLPLPQQKPCLTANPPTDTLLMHQVLACALPAPCPSWLPLVHPQTVFLLRPMADSCLHVVSVGLQQNQV